MATMHEIVQEALAVAGERELNDIEKTVEVVLLDVLPITGSQARIGAISVAAAFGFGPAEQGETTDG